LRETQQTGFPPISLTDKQNLHSYLTGSVSTVENIKSAILTEPTKVEADPALASFVAEPG